MFGNLSSFGLSGDWAARARTLAKALKKAYPAATDAGIAGILGNWEQESGLSPSAIDPADHGSGLGQWTNVGGSRRESKMRAYLRR
ncbi:phage tail tip lysozyme, partial [Staphylococcus haemolyticus]|uniref:phage tail tip lysozyme n=1 Tax=Staphylococcus haemolyticus TaxID=1283 RepID=UPI001C6066F9